MSYQPDERRHPFDRPQRESPVHPLDRDQPQQTDQPQPRPAQQPVRPRVDAPYSSPVLAYVLLGTNILVFLIDMLLGGQLTQLGAKENTAILNGEYWRLVTPLFLHGGFLHLFFNSYFLYIIGPQLERQFGTARFAAIYLLSGIGGALASFALTRAPSIGASGALFGVIGSWIPLLYRNQDVLRNARRQIRRIAWVIGVNLLIGLTPGIDNWAHLGGLVVGLALGWVASPRYAIKHREPDYVRIDDTSESSIVWFLITLVAVGLGGLTLALLWVRS